jgi:hypothetical protein
MLAVSENGRPPPDDGSVRGRSRDRVDASGAVQHLLTPEYHGDPVNPDGGILCFRHFGWDMLEELRRAGFESAEALLLWSGRFGYLGGEQLLFVARK